MSHIPRGGDTHRLWESRLFFYFPPTGIFFPPRVPCNTSVVVYSCLKNHPGLTYLLSHTFPVYQEFKSRPAGWFWGGPLRRLTPGGCSLMQAWESFLRVAIRFLSHGPSLEASVSCHMDLLLRLITLEADLERERGEEMRDGEDERDPWMQTTDFGTSILKFSHFCSVILMRCGRGPKEGVNAFCKQDSPQSFA